MFDAKAHYFFLFVINYNFSVGLRVLYEIFFFEKLWKQQVNKHARISTESIIIRRKTDAISRLTPITDDTVIVYNIVLLCQSDFIQFLFFLLGLSPNMNGHLQQCP